MNKQIEDLKASIVNTPVAVAKWQGILAEKKALLEDLKKEYDRAMDQSFSPNATDKDSIALGKAIGKIETVEREIKAAVDQIERAGDKNVAMEKIKEVEADQEVLSSVEALLEKQKALVSKYEAIGDEYAAVTKELTEVSHGILRSRSSERMHQNGYYGWSPEAFKGRMRAELGARGVEWCVQTTGLTRPPEPGILREFLMGVSNSIIAEKKSDLEAKISGVLMS